MATPSFAFLLIALAMFYPSPAFGLSNSEKGPRALLSHTISSSNNHEDQSLTSILSKQGLNSKLSFCTVATRSCSSEIHNLKPFDVINEVYEGIEKKSPYTQKFDSSFFRESSLKPGTKIHLSELQEEFPERGDLKQEASKIFCNGIGLQKLLSQPFTPNEAIQSTITKYCNMPSLKGSKIQSCTKSLDQMVEFSKNALGSKHLVALTTKSIKIKDTGKQLKIGNVQKIKVDKMVTCHGVLLDSATYFCHLIPTKQVIYVVDVIKPGTTSPVNTVLAICHTDTSEWSKDHVAFTTLKSSPGKTEACHWNTDLDLIWVGDY